MRLDGSQLLGVQHLVFNAKTLAVFGCLGQPFIHIRLMPIQLQPAALADQMLGTGGFNHRAVGVLAAHDQRGPFPGDLFIAFATRVEPVLQQRAGCAQHAEGPIADIHRAVGQYPQQGWYVPGEGVGAYCFTLDDAGITEGGFPAWLPAIHEGDFVPSTQQVPGYRYADHAGAKNDDLT